MGAHPSAVSQADSSIPSLLVGVGPRTCALPLVHVVETMRPRPIEALSGAPPFVLGVSIVRGGAVPVVHLGRLVGAPDAGAVTRFVTIRSDPRVVALAVEGVLGVRALPSGTLHGLPPLLRGEGQEGGASGVVEAVGHLDTRLLVVLRATRIVPASVWERVAATVAERMTTVEGVERVEAAAARGVGRVRGAGEGPS